MEITVFEIPWKYFNKGELPLFFPPLSCGGLEFDTERLVGFFLPHVDAITDDMPFFHFLEKGTGRIKGTFQFAVWKLIERVVVELNYKRP